MPSWHKVAGDLIFDQERTCLVQVLNRERAKPVPGLLQLLGVILGFGLLLLIEIFGKLSF